MFSRNVLMIEDGKCLALKENGLVCGYNKAARHVDRSLLLSSASWNGSGRKETLVQKERTSKWWDRDGEHSHSLMPATHSKHIPGPFDAVSDRAPAWKRRREEPSQARNRKPSSLCGPARVTLSPNLTWFGDADACLALFFIKLHGGKNGEILMIENGAFRTSVQKQTITKRHRPPTGKSVCVCWLLSSKGAHKK